MFRVCSFHLSDHYIDTSNNDGAMFIVCSFHLSDHYIDTSNNDGAMFIIIIIIIICLLINCFAVKTELYNCSYVMN